MTATIRNRLLSTLLVLFGVSLIVFLLLQLVPGDPAVTILGSGATAEAVAALRTELGLDAHCRSSSSTTSAASCAAIWAGR